MRRGLSTRLPATPFATPGGYTKLALGQIKSHLLKLGQVIRTIRNLLSHKELKTHMIYTHMFNCGPLGVRSPALKSSPNNSVTIFSMQRE